MSSFHHTKAYRHWKKRVYVRGKGKCAVTGSRVKLRTHHLFNVKDHPKFKTHIKKGKLISKDLHHIFHTQYMGGYGVKCTLDDWNKFELSIKPHLEMLVKTGLIRV
jgi:hypothetical protein